LDGIGHEMEGKDLLFGKSFNNGLFSFYLFWIFVFVFGFKDKP